MLTFYHFLLFLGFVMNLDKLIRFHSQRNLFLSILLESLSPSFKILLELLLKKILLHFS